MFGSKKPAPPAPIRPAQARRILTTQLQSASNPAFGIQYHGHCAGCVWKAGNTVGWGLDWCRGCRFFDGIDRTLPDRREGDLP